MGKGPRGPVGGSMWYRVSGGCSPLAPNLSSSACHLELEAFHRRGEFGLNLGWEDGQGDTGE